MKKIIMNTVICGAILAGTSATMTNVYAADVLSGDTAVNATVGEGNVTLTVDDTIDFGSQQLSDIIDFGSKDINYKVTDYSGNEFGYSVTAVLGDDDTTRTLNVGGTDLSTTAAEVVTETSSSAGEHPGTLPAALQYEGVTTPGALSSSITWTLTKATSMMIAE